MVLVAQARWVGCWLHIPASTSSLCSIRGAARCDFYLPMLSTWGALQTTAIDDSARSPLLLWADPGLMRLAGRRELCPDRRLQDRNRLARLAGFDFLESLAFDSLGRGLPPLANVPGVKLISLQKGFGSEQVAGCGFPVVDFSDRLDEAAGPLMDTAAVIRNLDLVVTSDTAIGHLAGMRPAPVWIAHSNRFERLPGCSIAKIPPGIRPCGSSGRRHTAVGRTFSGGWPRPQTRLSQTA